MTNELLPFNLEEALKNPERVVCRNGQKPSHWFWFEKANQESYCISSVIGGNLETHLINGHDLLGHGTSSYDLMLLPIIGKCYWVNLHQYANEMLYASTVFETEEECKFRSNQPNFIKTITFTI